MLSVDPFTELVMEKCLTTARAWSDLHDREVGGALDSEHYFELCKQAGYTEEQAWEAAKQRGLERLRRDLPA